MATDQRERLMGALVVLADARGYGSLRVEDLIAQAGVARGAFYAQFRGREDLLLTTVREIGALALREAESAYRADPRPRTGIEALIGFAVAQRAAARLWLVEAYGAGPDGIAAARQGLAGFDAFIAGAALAPELVAALTGAVHRTIGARLRLRHEGDLQGLAGPLAEWAGGYEPPPTPLSRPRRSGDQATDSRIAPRDQAERILLGLCDAVYDKGYAATTLADVAKRAATSIRTFYAHYETKQEAFVDAVDLAQVQSEAAMVAASRRASDWPHAVRAGLTALCNYYAAEPPLAETVIVEVHAAGEQALRRHGESLAATARLLEPGFGQAPDTPPIVREAVPAAIDALLFDAIRAGGGARLRALAPTATYLALSPFLGPEAACGIANAGGRPPRRRRP